MISVIAIAGEPATGKSTLMKSLMLQLKDIPMADRWEDVPCLVFKKDKVCILGVYDGGVFGGTDRLSMTIIEKAEKTLFNHAHDAAWGSWSIWLEGDRLSNNRFFNYVIDQKIPHKFFMLIAAHDMLKVRHSARDNQNAGWVKGRRTKYLNLAEVPAFDFEQLPSNTITDMLTNVDAIMKACNILREKTLIAEMGYV